MSICFEMIALGAVSGTALGLKLGPAQANNFIGGKVILFNGIGLYTLGVLFFGVGKLLDGFDVVNGLREKSGNKADLGLGPDGDNDGVGEVGGVDKEDGDVTTCGQLCGGNSPGCVYVIEPHAETSDKLHGRQECT